MVLLVPIRPEPARRSEAIGEAFASRDDRRVTHTRDLANREYSAPVTVRRWSELCQSNQPLITAAQQ
jgi:hypothetical protein